MYMLTQLYTYTGTYASTYICIQMHTAMEPQSDASVRSSYGTYSEQLWHTKENSCTLMRYVN